MQIFQASINLSKAIARYDLENGKINTEYEIVFKAFAAILV